MMKPSVSSVITPLIVYAHPGPDHTLKSPTFGSVISRGAERSAPLITILTVFPFAESAIGSAKRIARPKGEMEKCFIQSPLSGGEPDRGQLQRCRCRR